MDPWIALRLLRYMVRIWEDRLRKTPAKLPVIIPVVLAQNDRKWELSPEFASLLEVPPGAAGFVPNFAFRLVQLAEIRFERIAGTRSGILVLRALKAEQSGDLLGDALWDEGRIAEAQRWAGVSLGKPQAHLCASAVQSAFKESRAENATSEV